MARQHFVYYRALLRTTTDDVLSRSLAVYRESARNVPYTAVEAGIIRAEMQRRADAAANYAIATDHNREVIYGTSDTGEHDAISDAVRNVGPHYNYVEDRAMTDDEARAEYTSFPCTPRLYRLVMERGGDIAGWTVHDGKALTAREAGY